MHWQMDSDDAGSEGCAAYLMVAALDAHSGALLSGYDQGRCVMMNVNATRLALAWHGSTPLHEVHGGEQIWLRIRYTDDAVVNAVGK